MQCAKAKGMPHFRLWGRAGDSRMFRVFAPAKINLALHVTGQRGDGYHLLDTLVGFADVGDLVDIGAASQPAMHVTGPEAAGLLGENIITRLLAAFDAPPLSVTLHKVLPIASGIGGGSSDAAAAYRGMNALLRRAPTPSDAAPLLAVGADVPMCVAATPALVRGIGEVILPVPNLAPLPAVLVNPRVHVATPIVFKALNIKTNPELLPLPALLNDAGVVTKWLAQQRNDLQTPATACAPIIADVLDALSATGAALVRMSGSGATCFGLYGSAQLAQTAAAALRRSAPDWWITPCTINSGVGIAPQAIRTTT